MGYDQRCQAMNQIKCMPFDYLLCLFYPRLYAVHMLTQNVSHLGCSKELSNLGFSSVFVRSILGFQGVDTDALQVYMPAGLDP